MRRRHRYVPKRPLTGRRRAARNGAAKASPPNHCRSALAAQIASTGAGPSADSIRSTAATCQWLGGGMLESAPAMRLTRFRSRDREPSGAPPRTRTSAPKACRRIQAKHRRLLRRHRSPKQRSVSGQPSRLDGAPPMPPADSWSKIAADCLNARRRTATLTDFDHCAVDLR
jgi:hypothetical protein